MCQELGRRIASKPRVKSRETAARFCLPIPSKHPSSIQIFNPTASRRVSGTNPLKQQAQWHSLGKLLALRTSSFHAQLNDAQYSPSMDSYNRYLAIAARVVRRSLKDDLRIQAEKRGEMELRFAKWEVSVQLSLAGTLSR